MSKWIRNAVRCACARRRVRTVSILVVFIWIVCFANFNLVFWSNFQFFADPHSDTLKAESVTLSRERHGPAVAREDYQTPAETSAAQFSVLDSKSEKSEHCELTYKDLRQFPNCQKMIERLRATWKSDLCYAAHGVDGSLCSFLAYLSEKGGWCPKQNWTSSLRKENSSQTYASVTTDLQGLLDLLKDPNQRQAYAWIRLRVSRLWPRWVQAVCSLGAKQDLTKRTKHKILVHMGLLSSASSWRVAENQFKGGPLGELVQWSDLISVLYILGHQLTITSEAEQLVQLLHKMGKTHRTLPLTVIYTDLVGNKQLKKIGSAYSKLRCLLRIVDSFGTEPVFNYRPFARQKETGSAWGGLNLDPRQFFTMFPHSPDNSFMGFVVEHHLNDTGAEEEERKDIAVVYGKNEYMWDNKTSYLDVIKNYLQIHATVSSSKGKSKLPAYVVNHGILSGAQLQRLLRQAKVFVGLGFPYEGPAPLEAIANGAVFLNPRFTPPHSRKNTKFFKGKPTEREVTSQNPYAEMFIGKPHVYTIDIDNHTDVQAALQEILAVNKFRAFTPYEFTEEGMVQRMSAYLQHQQFCNFERTVSKWPPPSALTFVMGHTGQSCAHACWQRDLICEPSYFKEINTKAALKNRSSDCSRVSHSASIYFPSVDVAKQECILQDNEMLFSCVGGKDNFRRLCPCRNYIPQQSALCRGCER